MTQANTSLLKRALDAFSKGKYSETLTILEQMHGDRETEALVHYWKGHCRFKLKDFALATSELRQAISLGMKADDLQFTLGQSLFAAQKLEEAKAAFERSAEQKYKVGPSLYYVGYILQTLERNRSAAETYAQVIKLRDDPDKVKQAALFQIAEMKYDAYERDRPDPEDKGETAKRSERPGLRNLEQNILPMYIEARDMEAGTPTYSEAKAKVDEIKNFLAKKKPKSYITARATFEFGYDTNVITKADENTVTSISQQDSAVFKPTLRINYEKPIGKKWSMDLGLRAAAKLYTERGTASIHKNDNFTVEPAAAFERKNTLFAEPGTLFLTYEYNYQLQDYKFQHHFPYFSRSHNFESGQRMNPFKTGQSTLKANIKFFESQNPATNSIQPGVELNQKFKIGAHSLSSTLGLDWLIARTAINDTATIKFNNRYPIDWGKGWNFTPKLNFSLIDPHNARPTRGVEKKWNPGLSFRKQLESGAIWRLSYDYTRIISKDKVNQQYSRHEYALSYEVRF